MRTPKQWGAVFGLAVLLTACTPAAAPDAGPGPNPASPSTPEPTPEPTRSTEPTTAPQPTNLTFRAAAAMADVRALAGRIGPRLATGPGFRRAGAVVTERFRGHGYDVTRHSFSVPAGDSWGVPVRSGRSFNVIATPTGFDPAEPHLVVGAHLDTIAVAPGAEDNASGVGVLLELTRLAAAGRTRLPTVFVAFGAEEPRGDGDHMHHFGSQHYVRAMSRAQRTALVSMVSLDRVGVGSVVPVCTGPLSPPDVQNRILRLARRNAIPAQRCDSTASDHWSFEKAGFPVARFGSTPYAEYHSAADRPGVVNPRQLARTGRLAWSWLTG